MTVTELFAHLRPDRRRAMHETNPNAAVGSAPVSPAGIDRVSPYAPGHGEISAVHAGMRLGEAHRVPADVMALAMIRVEHDVIVNLIDSESGQDRTAVDAALRRTRAVLDAIEWLAGTR